MMPDLSLRKRECFSLTRQRDCKTKEQTEVTCDVCGEPKAVQPSGGKRGGEAVEKGVPSLESSGLS